jgi:hypothetical protein
MMLNILNNCNQLIQKREVIHENINQLSKLSDEFTNLLDLQETSSDLTSGQINFLNEKRINLRHNLVNLKDGLRIHYGLEEEILHPLIGLLLMQTLTTQHEGILKKLNDIDTIILNLSPMGILFNSIYLKQEVDNVCQTINHLNWQENSLLTFSGVCRNEEPL